jgi:hypothetical protein
VTLRVSFRFDGLAVVNVAQRAFHLYITFTVSGGSLGKFMTTMLQDRLTSLAVLHVHRDIDIDIDRVMRSFYLL